MENSNEFYYPMYVCFAKEILKTGIIITCTYSYCSYCVNTKIITIKVHTYVSIIITYVAPIAKNIITLLLSMYSVT